MGSPTDDTNLLFKGEIFKETLIYAEIGLSGIKMTFCISTEQNSSGFGLHKYHPTPIQYLQLKTPSSTEYSSMVAL